MEILLLNEDNWENNKIKNLLSKKGYDCIVKPISKSSSLLANYIKLDKPDLVIIDVTLYAVLQTEAIKFVSDIYFVVLRSPFQLIDGLDLLEGITFLNRPIIQDEFYRVLNFSLLQVRDRSNHDPVTSNDFKDTLQLKEEDGIRFVNFQRICRLSSDNNYTEIYLESGERIISSKSLKSFEKTLGGFGFFRVHQSHLVPLHRIKKIVSKDGLYVCLDNDCLVKLARRRKVELLEKMHSVQV